LHRRRWRSCRLIACLLDDDLLLFGIFKCSGGLGLAPQALD